TQRLHAPRADVDPVYVEEFDVGDLPAVDLVEDLVGVGPLDLEAIMRPIDRLAVRTALGAGVVDEPDVVAADRRVEAYPVGRRRAADEHELILTLPEKDHVADHVPGRRD